ncbi:unnamed protein product [Urochloa humidicola]
MLASLFLLGTWASLLTLLERRGRLPSQTSSTSSPNLDYSITNLLAAVVIAVKFGQVGETRPARLLHSVQLLKSMLFKLMQPECFIYMITGLQS